ncbi:putative N-acetylgalactosamine-N, N'-diacetylbacillosaminyl-diphospho-undecaprenol 4-alpha-N-acetylgalactosaminyltransferase [Tenacibaculum sp. 190524A02b]
MFNKKIILVIPTLKQGGAERVISELANNSVKFENLEVILILLAKSEDFYEINNQVNIHRLGFEGKGKLNKIKSQIGVFFRLRKLLKEEKPDAVLSFMEKYNSFTIIASTFLGLKIFVSDRNNPMIKKSIIKKLLKRFTYNKAEGIIAQTQLAKSVLVAKIKNKNIKVIPNPVKKIKSHKIKKEKIILNIGRLVPEKGQQYLIEAFSKLQDKSWKLIILGEGTLRKELEKQIEVLELEDKIFLMGSVKNVDEWLSRASIFAFTSISEGFPNALVEAMSAGLPCISFDCNAGPRDIIENEKNGILIPVRSIDSLVNSINRLIKSEELRYDLGIKAQRINDKLNVKKITQRYLNFLEVN